jgi:hypothetical protein
MTPSALTQARADHKQAQKAVDAALASLDDLQHRAEATAAELDAAQANVRAASMAMARGDPGAETAFQEATRRAAELKARREAFDAEVLPMARERHEAALAAEQEAAKLIRYVEAKSATKAASDKLKRDYPQLAEIFADLLNQVRDASALVRAANADLPAGLSPLPEPEEFRDRPRRPREVLSEERVLLWAYEHSGEPLNEETAAMVHDKGGGRGVIHAPEGRFMRNPHYVERRWFNRVTFRPEESRQMGPRLSNMAAPPPLSVDEGPPEPRVQLVPAATPGAGEA